MNSSRSLLAMMFVLAIFTALQQTSHLATSSSAGGNEPALTKRIRHDGSAWGVVLMSTAEPTDVEGDGDSESTSHPMREAPPIVTPAATNESEPASNPTRETPPVVTTEAPAEPEPASNPMRETPSESLATLAPSSSDGLPILEESSTFAETPPVELPTQQAGQLSDGRPERRMLAALHVGTCDVSDIGIKIVQLNDLIVPAGEVLGSVDAIPVGAGVTVVDHPMADLVEGDLVIVVFDEMDPESLVACGGIGGVLDANGALSVGLVPMNESGASGIAYMNPAVAGSATGFSIFVQQEADS